MNQGIGVLSQYIQSAVRLNPTAGGEFTPRSDPGKDPFADSVRLTISATGRSLAGVGSDTPVQGPSDPLALARGRASAQHALQPLRQEGNLLQQNAARLDKFTDARNAQGKKDLQESIQQNRRDPKDVLDAVRKERENNAELRKPREPLVPTPDRNVREERTRERNPVGEGLVPRIPEAEPRPLAQPQAPESGLNGSGGAGLNLFPADGENRNNLAPRLGATGDGNRLQRPPFAPRNPGETSGLNAPEPDRGLTTPQVGGENGALGTRPGAVAEEPPRTVNPNGQVRPDAGAPPPVERETAPQPTSVGEDRTLPNAADVAVSRFTQVSALRTYSQVAGFGAQNDASQGAPFARVA